MQSPSHLATIDIIGASRPDAKGEITLTYGSGRNAAVSPPDVNGDVVITYTGKASTVTNIYFNIGANASIDECEVEFDKNNNQGIHWIGGAPPNGAIAVTQVDDTKLTLQNTQGSHSATYRFQFNLLWKGKPYKSKDPTIFNNPTS